MLWVVCYDISDDAMRDRMSDLLLDFGSRIQESVFECSLSEADLKQMVERMSRTPLRDTDKVRIYKVCARCAEEIQIYGPGEVTSDREYYVV